MRYIGKVFAIICIAAVLALGTAIYVREKQHARDERIQAELNSFVEEIATSGKLTAERYEEFMAFLATEGKGIKINIEHLTPDGAVE